MSADITRSTFNPTKHYSGVRQQQGRVSLDADWNEQVDIASHRVQTGALDTFGHSGAPRDNAGFGIGPLSQPVLSNDMSISPGRIYVDGILCELESTFVPIVLPATAPAGAVQAQLAGLVVDGQEFKAGQWVEISAQDNSTPLQIQIVAADAKAQTLTLPPIAASFVGKPGPQLRRITTYLTQSEVPSPAPLPTSGVAIAYLDVWERPITALEDAEIRESALGSASGADTTTRTRTVRQVKVQPVSVATTCANAPAFDSSAFDIAIRPSTARLAARAEPTAAASSACILPPQAGFRRLENQLYRVEIHSGGDVATGAPVFKWSRDNGSVTTSIVATPPALSGSTLTLNVASLGRDQVLNFAIGQFVELTDDSRELQNKPGVLVKLTGAAMSAQGPVLTADTSSAASADVSSFLNAFSISMNPKVRRWDQPSAGVTLKEGTWLDLESGVQVFFEPGGRYRTGDYWLIPARTLTGNIDWPRDSAGNPLFAKASGILHHYCRLAVINFSANSFHVIGDCRPMFPTLSETGMHINNVFLQNGSLVLNDGVVSVSDLAAGISITCDTPVDPASLQSGTFTKPTCFVAVDFPNVVAGQKPFAIQRLVVSAQVTLDPADTTDSTILWKPIPDAFTWLTGTLAQTLIQNSPFPLFAHLTLKGNFIWARDNPLLLLDGETFGAPAAPDAAGNLRTDILLPSGDGRRGGDFEMWFRLIAPSLAVSSTTLDLGTQTIASAGPARTVSVTNSSNTDLVIVSAVSPGDFTLSATTCPASPSTLPVGGTCTISIVFNPSAAGARSATLTVTPNIAAVTPVSVLLTGNGAPPVGAGITVSPPAVNFVAQIGDAATQGVTVANTGAVPVTISNITATPNNFTVDAAVPVTIAPGKSFDFDATFEPPSGVPKTTTGQMVITLANAPALSVKLKGISKAATIPPGEGPPRLRQP